MKKHIVRLDRQSREGLRQLASSGMRPAQVVRRCQILLKSDSGCTDEEVAEHVGCTTRNVRAVRKRFNHILDMRLKLGETDRSAPALFAEELTSDQVA